MYQRDGDYPRPDGRGPIEATWAEEEVVSIRDLTVAAPLSVACVSIRDLTVAAPLKQVKGRHTTRAHTVLSAT